MQLEKLCHGQQCYLSFGGHCNGNPSTVVPCHLRIGGVAGMGQKPPPLCCLPGCFNCHNVLDGRARSEYSQEQIRAMTLVGLNKWLAYLWNNEYVIGVTP